MKFHNSRRYRLYLKVAVKLMLIVVLVTFLSFFVSGFLPQRAKGSDVIVETLADLKVNQPRMITWHNKKLWLLKRSHAQVLALRDYDDVVFDPWSDDKPLPMGVNHLHRGLLPQYLLIFSQGEKCEVILDASKAEFYEPCDGYRYDLAGRLLKGTNINGLAEHLRVPDYRIVGAQLIIGGEITQ